MAPQTRYQRRKEDRPQEIADAAFEVFAEKGYAATRVDDVAKRAGVSKGLTYLYYKTKEELFKAVIKNVVVKRVDALVADLNASDLTAEEFMRGPLLTFMKAIPGSPVAIVVRLLIAEGPKYPELLEFYYDNVVSRGIGAIEGFIERGIASGEFKPDAKRYPPHLLIAPVMVSVIWRLLFNTKSLNTDALIEAQIELLLAKLKTE